MNEETLFHEALAKSPADRAGFLEQACAGQPALRAAVEALLVAHEAAGNLLDQRAPAAPLATGEFTPEPDDAPAHPVKTTDYQPQAEPGVVIAGRYTLQEKIGEGGMGEVWVAKQTEPVKRRVALKLIKSGMDTKAVLQRFDAERQALAMMDHPNIAKVLDGGMTPDRRPFFVMELVNGLPLTKFCDEAKLGIRERLELFAAICQAVQHAHQKGIIHRDLKPSNILVTLIDAKPVPKVIDFGVAKAIGGKLLDESLSTQFGAVVGTLEYMSPEQASFSGTDIDTRADIYSLGVMLYELLTGLRPIDGTRLKKQALTEMIRIIKEEEPSKPSTRLSTNESLPSLAALRQTEPRKLMAILRGELDWVVMKCLEKHRDRRYETANGLARDIQHYLADEPVDARPPSASYRLGKFLRRNKGPVITASVVALVLIGGIVGTSVGMVRAEQRRVEAVDAKEREAEQRGLAQTNEAKAVAAAAAEKTAKEKAQSRLAQIEKGVELFAGLVRGLNPRAEEQGAPPLYQQLRQRAAKAADELVGEAVGDAEAVARLQTLLGDTLLGLGDLAKAAELLERARATREAKLGADHPDTLETLNNLAQVYQAAGKLPEAIVMLERVKDASVKKRGADHPDTLTGMNNLAGAYRDAGRLPEAIALLEQVRDAWVKELGADHPDTLLTLNNLALAYYATGKSPEAIALFEQVKDAQIKKRGADHSDTLATMNNLAGAYQAARKLPEAIALFEQVKDAQVRKLGADHPDTLVSMNNLALGYRAAARLPEAIPLFEQVRDAQVKKLGTDHPNTLATLNNLATAYRAAGKLPEAIALFEQVKDALVKKLGADHPDTIITLNNLAGAYQTVGKLPEAILLYEQAAAGLEKRRFQHEYASRIIPNTITAYELAKQLDKAEAWRRKWLAVVKERAGANSPSYAGELAALGSNLLDQRKWAEAETALKECLAVREKTQPDAWQTFNTKSSLGGALLGQRKYADAKPLLLAGYEGMKQREKTIPPQGKVRLLEAIERLVQLYEAMDKKDDAAKWRKELEAIKTAKPNAEAKP